MDEGDQRLEENSELGGDKRVITRRRNMTKMIFCGVKLCQITTSLMRVLVLRTLIASMMMVVRMIRSVTMLMMTRCGGRLSHINISSQLHLILTSFLTPGRVQQ